MNISNVTDFYHLVKTSNLQSFNSNLNVFLDCVDNYNRICNCKSNEKSNKYRECHDLYKRNVLNDIASIKHEIFKNTTDNTVVFYDGGSVILTLIK